ncbi:MAG: hypothetical protein GY839_05010 [candidate division Zixibacteria bacterium]|nr:hypothetical protein [candidate division Zixibacteria bacterium]
MRTWIIAGLCVFLVRFSLAQQSDLTVDQLKDYNSKKISIVINTADKQSKGWRAYWGYRSISERRLFELAGHFDQVMKIQNHKNGGIAKIAAGVALFALGSGFILGAKNKADESGKAINRNQVILGFGGLFAGLGIAGSGFNQIGGNWAPYTIARGVAEEYNQGLVIQIKGEL